MSTRPSAQELGPRTGDSHVEWLADNYADYEADFKRRKGPRRQPFGLLGRLSRQPRILDVVWTEVVVEGKAGQHPDAFVIDAALRTEPRDTAPDAPTIDQAVLQAAVADGVLLANDLTLGRRARSLGARWLRSADLLVLLSAAGRCTHEEARNGIESLWSAGRITDSLRDEYLERIG